MSHKFLHRWTTRGSSINATSLQKIYPCQVCNQTFRRNCYLNLHIKSHVFRCAHCHKSFKHKLLLRHHIYSVHSVVTKEFKANFTCEHCSKDFELKHDYKIHLWVHHRHKYVCGYQYCRKEFKSPEEYIQHRMDHTISSCNICGKEVKHIVDHMKVHSRKMSKCDICQKIFKQCKKFQRHMRIHLKVKPFSCSDCGKSFTKEHNMIIHNRIHTGKKPFECKECKKRFVRSTALKLHKLLVHGGEDARSFKCDQCDFSTVAQWKLKRHQTTIHSVIYECSLCNMTFVSSADFKTHTLTHSNVKPFACAHCDKKYLTQGALTKHLTRFHTSTEV